MTSFLPLQGKLFPGDHVCSYNDWHPIPPLVYVGTFSTNPTPPHLEAVSQYKETDLLEDGERWLGEKDLER